MRSSTAWGFTHADSPQLPHPTDASTPDDAVLFDLLEQWAPDERTRHKILVESPATLYEFQKT